MSNKWGLAVALVCGLGAGGALQATEPAQKAQVAQANAQSFTGQIKGNRVRMRLHADRDSAIIDELERGQLVAVVGEDEEFYEVLPPQGTRAYVFRTYILDNRVEGNRVNVRLQPGLDAPVIAQLNDGDYVHGEVSQLNNKWIEIPPPATTRFYVAKEFVENVGGADYLPRIEKRQQEATHLVNSAYATGQAELHKSFQEIKLEPMLTQLQLVLDDYNDVPQEVARASYYLTLLKDTYLQKKIQHLEAKANAASNCFQNHCDEFGQRVKAQQNVLDALEQGIPVDFSEDEEEIPMVQMLGDEEQPAHLVSKGQQRARFDANSWLAKEVLAFEVWRAADHANSSMHEFYQDQMNHALHQSGIIQPYTRPVTKKPGNFLLLDPHDNRPIAFLYSTQIDLQTYAGQICTLTLSPRPNNNFAFPSYYVLSVD